MKLPSILTFLLITNNANAFSITKNPLATTTSRTCPSSVQQQQQQELQQQNTNQRTASLSPLFMGRAAAVRAATKSKTDAKKAKTNATYGKKIIMAVKQGGPDPDANRALGDLIKAAKANSVPVDVSLYVFFLF